MTQVKLIYTELIIDNQANQRHQRSVLFKG